MGLPLALLLVLLVTSYLDLVDSEASDLGHARNLGILIVVTVLALFALRFTYAVFVVVPLLLAIKSWRTPQRAIGGWMLSITVVMMGVVAIGASVENRAEFDEFSPSARGQPVRYYFAWQQVFVIHSENAQDPALASFYDGGVVHDFSREVDRLELSPSGKKTLYDAEIEAMFDAAGLSATRVRAATFVNALAGGRLNDIAPSIEAVIDSRRTDLDWIVYRNGFAVRNGQIAFVDRYNDGQMVEALVTNPVGKPLTWPSSHTLIAILLPLAVVAMAISLFTRHRTLGAIGLLVVVSFAFGMGWLFADNFRFLFPTSVFGIAIGTALVATAADNHRAKRLTENLTTAAQGQ